MMTELDTAGLVVIAGQVLGIGTDAALSQLDIPPARGRTSEVFTFSLDLRERGLVSGAPTG